MAQNDTIDILNELLGLEQTSVIERLHRSGVFVSRAWADGYPVVKRMTEDVHEHGQWLVQLILDLRGGVWPLCHLLPRVIDNEKTIIAKYELARSRLALEPQAIEVVSRILARHSEHVEQLTRFLASG